MTPLQRDALNRMIDQREDALDAGRAQEAKMWQDIILHSWEAAQRYIELPHGNEAAYLPTHTNCSDCGTMISYIPPSATDRLYGRLCGRCATVRYSRQ